MADSSPPSTDAQKVAPKPGLLRRAMTFYLDNYLPLMMIIVVIFGYFVPAPGKALDKPKINLCADDEPDCDMGRIKVTSSVCVMCIFLLSGLGLKTDDIKTALTQWKAILYAFVSINFLTGMISFLLVELPFEPKELSIGLAVFSSMPTTLSSGAVLVGVGNGNVTLALLLTAGTNILGIFTIPFMLKLYLSTSTDIEIKPAPMLIKLCVTILVPLAIGKALRNIQPLVDFRLKHKPWFGRLSSTFLVTVPLMKVSSASERLEQMMDDKPANLVLIIVCGVLLHITFLTVNILLSTPLRLEVAERKAVVILTSQKTLPVAVTVISFLDDSMQLGIIVIPCIVGHLMQLLMDSVFVSKWALRTAPGGPLGLGSIPDSGTDLRP